MKQLLIFLLCITVTALAGAIQEGTLKASSDGNNVTVEWMSADESSVIRYEVERRSEGAGFGYIYTIQKKGSNQRYKYTDESAFKTTGTVYYYRIKIVSTNGVEYSSEVNVPHNVNSVKRTWGSLKAMFR